MRLIKRDASLQCARTTGHMMTDGVKLLFCCFYMVVLVILGISDVLMGHPQREGQEDQEGHGWAQSEP